MTQEEIPQKEIIAKLLKRGILVSPGAMSDEKLRALLDEDVDPDMLIAHTRGSVASQEGVDWLAEESRLYGEQMENGDAADAPPVNIVMDAGIDGAKRTVNDFINHFNRRYVEISNLLRTRNELSHLVSINRAKSKEERETVSIIGMVLSKTETKNNNILLEIEDPTGIIKVVVSQRNQEQFAIAKDLVLDETIGIHGMYGGNIIFANLVVLPNIPLGKELRKHPEEIYLAIFGDTHFGADLFLRDDFSKAIQWLRSEAGTPEQREMARRIKYVVFTGDIADGVGIYPGQEEDLTIKDLKEQYAEAARHISRIPKDKRIIIIPGNHDAGRIAEPQQPITRAYAEDLYALPNVTMVGSPSMVNIASTPDFPGFDLLLYHGYSLIYYSDNVPSIREAGGQKRVDLIMKYLLQRRHLSPTHGCNMYVPSSDKDVMVINRIPDMFITGHIHRMSAANYRNVTMINASTWVDTSDEQIKRGLEPQPGRLPVINLQTREMKILNFYSK